MIICHEKFEVTLTHEKSTLVITGRCCSDTMNAYVSFKFDHYNPDDGYISLGGHEGRGIRSWKVELEDLHLLERMFDTFGFVYDFDTRPSKNWHRMREMALDMRADNSENDEEDENDGDDPEIFEAPPQVEQTERPRLDASEYVPKNISDEMFNELPSDNKFYVTNPMNYVLIPSDGYGFTLVGKDIDGTMVPFTHRYATQEEIDVARDTYGLTIHQWKEEVMIKSAMKR